MENEKTIAALNKLVVINNDRIEGYKTAVKDTDQSDLKGLFTTYLTTSAHIKSELYDEIRKMGGELEEGTKTTGKLYRMWMDLKAALTSNDRKSILDSCEKGEAVALETYDEVLEDENVNLSPAHMMVIRAQRARIKADHDAVKAMRDSTVSV